jgi:hypothetical protein
MPRPPSKKNPVTGARRAYPFVVVLQSDVAQTGRDRAWLRLHRAPRSLPFQVGLHRS